MQFYHHKLWLYGRTLLLSSHPSPLESRPILLLGASWFGSWFVFARTLSARGELQTHRINENTTIWLQYSKFKRQYKYQPDMIRSKNGYTGLIENEILIDGKKTTEATVRHVHQKFKSKLLIPSLKSNKWKLEVVAAKNIPWIEGLIGFNLPSLVLLCSLQHCFCHYSSLLHLWKCCHGCFILLLYTKGMWNLGIFLLT